MKSIIIINLQCRCFKGSLIKLNCSQKYNFAALTTLRTESKHMKALLLEVKHHFLACSCEHHQRILREILK